MLYLHQIFNGIWMIEYDFASNYIPIIANYIRGEAPVNTINQETKLPLTFATYQSSRYKVTPYGSYTAPENAPDESIAVLTVRGAITKHDQSCGPAGMIAQSNILDRCYSNDSIKGIVVEMESGGGEAYGMRLFNEAISRKNKPVIGFVNDIACSAAYGNISGCDMIIANSNMARIGSLGTYQTIADHTEAFKKRGINLIEIYATQSKHKNSDFHEALKGNLEPLRKTVDVFNENFLSTIENNRSGKLTADRNEWGTGKVYFSEDAKKIGLIDDIDTFENVLNYF